MKAKKKTEAIQGDGASTTKEFRKKLEAVGALHIGHDKETNRAFTQNLVQVPLDYYAMRGWIKPRQYDAGEEFFRLWYYGAVRARYVTQRDPREPRGGLVNYEINASLGKKYKGAKQAFRGLAQALVCFGVCCIGEFITGMDDKTNWVDEHLERTDAVTKALSAVRQTKSRWLREGLDDLADHFKIPRGKT